MAREARHLLYVGIRKSVLALDESSGEPLWRTDLSGSDFVTVLWDGDALFAANNGEVWRLDPGSGAILWHNRLKGFGLGLVSLASSRRANASGETELVRKKKIQQAAAAAT